MVKHFMIAALLGLAALTSSVQAQNESVIPSQKGERWWGGLVGIGAQMPYSSNTATYNLANQNFNNQVVPLLLSSQGRYVWAEDPFQYQFRGDTLFINSATETLEAVEAGKTLKEAYLAASKAHFPASGVIPDPIFFSKPQYNTWIELMYNQNQEDILDYANQVIKYDFPTGIFMVDDNWQKYYGNFDFKPDRFPDPKAMVDELHSKGFKVMLWVCPFVSPDSPEYRELAAKGFLVKQANSNRPALITWWNGVSACYDMTNPEATKHLRAKLDALINDFGIDGFKFDAGDVSYMSGNFSYHEEGADASIFSQRWAELGLAYPYNELRTSWKLGGEALVQRLGDKDYSWHASSLLIPDMAAAGLMGHLYTCPDMIGGGQFASFLNIDADSFDQELIVRSAQLHALMPMMQFSVAPWRILDEEHRQLCADAAHLHESMGDYILEVARESSKSGEPILRHMEYEFPNQGFVDCKDQFMLGSRYLVAPMVTKGTERKVTLPKGSWRDELGKKHRGGRTITIQVPLDRIPHFERLK